MTKDEVQEVENFVNARIEGCLTLEEQRSVPMSQAVSQGALALFGEKYADVVRTIRFGNSIELCGGTHVKNTSDIWHFKIKSEGAVAAGIRRIEAITFDAVKEFFSESNQQFNQVRALLNNAVDPVKSLTDLKLENNHLKKQLERLKNEKAMAAKTELIGEVKKINGLHFLARQLNLDANSLKAIAFEIGQQYDDLVLILASNHNEKALLSCYISKPLLASKDLNASAIIRTLGPLIDGGGGGQAFFATAGGKKPDGIPAALQKASEIISDA